MCFLRNAKATSSKQKIYGEIPMENIARTPKQIGNIIRSFRTQNKLTQAKLADKAGTLQRQISLIESGSDTLRIETICNVLAALDLIIKIEPISAQYAPKIEDIF